MCASLKPGTMVLPARSSTTVRGPISAVISFSLPTAANVPLVTAKASARGWFVSTVSTFTPRTTRSAGAAAHAVTPQIAMKVQSQRLSLMGRLNRS